MAAVGVFVKAGDMLSRRRGDDRVNSREDFESVNDRLKDENDRCHAEISRLRLDIEEVRAAHKVRIDQVHDLTNRLIEYQLREDIAQHPEQPEPPRQDENGDPR